MECVAGAFSRWLALCTPFKVHPLRRFVLLSEYAGNHVSSRGAMWLRFILPYVYALRSPVREPCRSAWGSESRKRCAEARLACFVLNTRSGSDHWRCSPRVGLVGLIRKRPYWNRGGGLISGPAALPLLSRAAVRGLDHGCWFSLSSSLSFSPWTSCSFGC